MWQNPFTKILLVEADTKKSENTLNSVSLELSCGGSVVKSLFPTAGMQVRSGRRLRPSMATKKPMC